MKFLNLDKEEDSILKWLVLVLKNRSITIPSLWAGNKDSIIENFLPDTSSVDVLVGYRADDRFFSYVKNFIMALFA